MKSQTEKYITAAILAGGKNSRFGSLKADAKVHSRRLIDFAYATARDVTPRLLLLSKSEKLLNGVPVLHDIVPDCGPLGGLYTALKYASTPFVMTVPVDMPLLSSDLYRYLFGYVSLKRPAVIRSESGLEPLAAIWPKSSISIIEKCLGLGEYSIRVCLAKLRANEIPVSGNRTCSQPSFFFNVNYPEDLQMLIQSEQIRSLSAV